MPLHRSQQNTTNRSSVQYDIVVAHFVSVLLKVSLETVSASYFRSNPTYMATVPRRYR